MKSNKKMLEDLIVESQDNLRIIKDNNETMRQAILDNARLLEEQRKIDKLIEQLYYKLH